MLVTFEMVRFTAITEMVKVSVRMYNHNFAQTMSYVFVHVCITKYGST